jgi:hypothetical protein
MLDPDNNGWFLLLALRSSLDEGIDFDSDNAYAICLMYTTRNMRVCADMCVAM